MKKMPLIALPLLLFASAAIGQRAELHLVNNSARTLTIKIMQENGPTADTLYSILSVSPYGRATEYFAQTGNYFLKTEAVLTNKAPVYTKGNPFQVYVGSNGYSVLTITYSITESNAPNPMEGARISKDEFDRN